MALQRKNIKQIPKRQKKSVGRYLRTRARLLSGSYTLQMNLAQTQQPSLLMKIVFLHIAKTNESCRIGARKDPIEAYLDINDIIRVANRAQVDAIHTGYGFLSENPNFIEACIKAGIIFISSSPNVMRKAIFVVKLVIKSLHHILCTLMSSSNMQRCAVPMVI